MPDTILTAIGGVGLFLMGMHIMTDALREVTGARLRRLLARFTTTPLRGVATGTIITAAIQSSSATTLMVVGFVGAGLLTLTQALGVIYGANIGTTFTGWIVALLGVKLKLGTMAMAALLPASLAQLLGAGRVARLGRVAAGFCLLFIGIDLMQDGMGGAARWITPQSLPNSAPLAMLLMGFAGFAITVAMQSSSAAIAVALILLGGGAISLPHGAAAVIGMNLGTTVTGLLAALGGSRPMLQTALANMLFNCGTALLAIPILAFGQSALMRLGTTFGPETALVLFHTTINLLGALAFLPITVPFTRAIRARVPDTAGPGAPQPDPRLLDDEIAAMQAAHQVALWNAKALRRALALAIGKNDLRPLAALRPRCGRSLDDLKDYLSRIAIPQDHALSSTTYSGLLHLMDHLTRLLDHTDQTGHIATLRADPQMHRILVWVAGALDPDRGESLDELGARLRRMAPLIGSRVRLHRRGLLLGEHVGLYSVQDTFIITDAMRWLEQALHNLQRAGRYDALLRETLGQTTAPAPK